MTHELYRSLEWWHQQANQVVSQENFHFTTFL